jgi:hypothetical protein
LKPFFRAIPPRYDQRSGCLAGGIRLRRPLLENTQ